MKAGRILIFACLFLWTGVSAWAMANSESRCSREVVGAISNARYYDPELGRFIQADPRIQGLANLQSYNRYSPWPVNVYPIICDGSIDRKLEAMTEEKGDAAELVLDGHLLGEHTSEVNLAELLSIARLEFNGGGGSDAVTTVDEAELEKEWPPLRAELGQLMTHWSRGTSGLIIGGPDAVSETVVPKFEPSQPSVKQTRPEMKQSVRKTTPTAPLWRRRLCAPKIAPILNTDSLPLWRAAND